jgi:hypothetical protein
VATVFACSRPNAFDAHFRGYAVSKKHDGGYKGVVIAVFPYVLDEGTVDLDFVNGKFPQVIQGRIPASEIVEGYPDPHFP